MSASNTRVLPFGKEAIAEAARLILAGEPVAVPTETVYGLAADATNAAAVARIYAAKGRPSFNPLIVHVRDLAAARVLALFSKKAIELAEAYWPGPLTLVLTKSAECHLPSIVTAGLSTIAIRVSAHPALQTMLGEVGRPLAAPSANASGTISPTRAEHVFKSLSGRIALIIDAGSTELGLESTIVAAEGDRLRLLRPGPIDLGLPADGGGIIEAPGMLARHYAPAKPLYLNATMRRADTFMIGFGAMTGDASLSLTGDPIEAAARLFDLLHRADASGCAEIAVAPIPDQGLGLAINDRLRRAAQR